MTRQIWFFQFVFVYIFCVVFPIAGIYLCLSLLIINRLTQLFIQAPQLFPPLNLRLYGIFITQLMVTIGHGNCLCTAYHGILLNPNQIHVFNHGKVLLVISIVVPLHNLHVM